VSEAATPKPTSAGPKSPWYRSPFVIAFVLGAIALTVLPFLQTFAMRAPEPVASLGAWKLTDQDGKPIGADELKGTVWIASIFFSRCATVCPPQQEAMAKILKHTDDLRSPSKPPIKLVSFTVDPEFDTPAVLTSYAKRLGVTGPVAAGTWSFVTGAEADLKDLLVKRMFVEVGDKQALPGDAGLFDIAHTSRFVLVDQNGDVRGYWETDDLGRGNLINAARLLWKRGPRP